MIQMSIMIARTKANRYQSNWRYRRWNDTGSSRQSLVTRYPHNFDVLHEITINPLLSGMARNYLFISSDFIGEIARCLSKGICARHTRWLSIVIISPHRIHAESCIFEWCHSMYAGLGKDYPIYHISSRHSFLHKRCLYPYGVSIVTGWLDATMVSPLPQKRPRRASDDLQTWVKTHSSFAINISGVCTWIPK